MRTPLRITRHDAVAELRGALRQTTRVSAQLRLRALLAVAQGEHVPRVAQLLHVAQRAVRHWVHRYNRSGLEGLRDRRGGRRGRLSPAQLERVRARLAAEPRPTDQVCSLRGVDIRGILRAEFHTPYARSSVYYLLHRTLEMSYVQPRPLHRQTDATAQAAFKKTSRKGWRRSGPSIRAGGWRSGSRTKAASGSQGR
jgi:transposase